MALAWDSRPAQSPDALLEEPKNITSRARKTNSRTPHPGRETRGKRVRAVRVHFKAFFGVLLWSIKTRARA
jgi:hypothetical protein